MDKVTKSELKNIYNFLLIKNWQHRVQQAEEKQSKNTTQ
jgi:hypothetical protein